MSGRNGVPLFSKGADGVNDLSCAKCCVCGGRIVVDMSPLGGDDLAGGHHRPEKFTRFIVDRGLMSSEHDERNCYFVCSDCREVGLLTENLVSLKIDQAKTKLHEQKAVKFYEAMKKYMSLIKPVANELMKKGFADEYEF